MNWIPHISLCEDGIALEWWFDVIVTKLHVVVYIDTTGVDMSIVWGTGRNQLLYMQMFTWNGFIGSMVYLGEHIRLKL